MKSWEVAMQKVSEYNERYSIIDPYIKPLCELLNKHGFITMHSCSGHVKTSSRNFTYISVPDGVSKRQNINFSFLKPSKDDRWYVMVVPKGSMLKIRRIIATINYKFGYEVMLRKVNDFDGVSNRWVIEERKMKCFNDDQLYQRHKNIYLEFKSHFEQEAVK